MIGFTEKEQTLYVEDVDFNDIAAQAGTPCYVYSAAHVKSQYDSLADAMKNALPADRQPMLCYACKANSNIAVLTLLKNLGAGLEIVSEGELRRGLRAGFDPKKIVSTGVGKSTTEIAACLEAGIRQFNVESLPELDHINEVAGGLGKTASIVFRLNPDISGGGHTKISTGRKQDKFGITEDALFAAFDRAKILPHVNALGISVHIGSQVFTVETFQTAFQKFPALVTALRDAGHTISRLDIGGGFPIQYNHENLLDLDSYARWVNDIIVPLDTDIIMEPGRYLVGNAGALLTRIVHIKETQDRDFIILDAAMNDMIRPMLYDAYHAIEPVANRNAAKKTYDVVGPVCETGDTFARQREIAAVKAGDLMVVRSAGAYGFCMASNYNTRPLPAEILVQESNFALIRQRQTYDELLEKDIIPHWLQK